MAYKILESRINAFENDNHEFFCYILNIQKYIFETRDYQKNNF